MKVRIRALLSVCVCAAGCTWFPSVGVGYRGTGDAGVVEFMRGNYMSSEAGVATYLKRHLDAGLRPGQEIDKAYLVQRGASCSDSMPVVCKFTGIANEHFRGMPKQHAHRARRVTVIEARVILAQPVQLEVVKSASYPDDPGS